MTLGSWPLMPKIKNRAKHAPYLIGCPSTVMLLKLRPLKETALRNSLRERFSIFSPGFCRRESAVFASGPKPMFAVDRFSGIDCLGFFGPPRLAPRSRDAMLCCKLSGPRLKAMILPTSLNESPLEEEEDKIDCREKVTSLNESP